MYAIKQIKICAEYRDMLPRPRLDLSGTPGLRPIGLSPGSWQTSLRLGSMSRYSAQILICIVKKGPKGKKRFSGIEPNLAANLPLNKWKRFPRYWLFGSLTGNSPVTGEFPLHMPVTRSFDVFFDLRFNKRLIKQSKRRWFEIPSHSLWLHFNDFVYAPSQPRDDITM